MRAAVSRALLRAWERNPGGAAGRIRLQLLMNATAAAFGKRGQVLLFARDPLARYAAFTKACLAGPCEAESLYRAAYRLGQRVRALSGLRKDEELQRLVFVLYRGIGITMRGTLPGEVRVSTCYFGRYYTAEDCARISAMDSGLIAGVYGSGALAFSQRLTEGCACCTACFRKGERHG